VLRRKHVVRAVAVALVVPASVWLGWNGYLLLRDQAPWTEAELGQIRSLWIGSLPPLPADPTNRVADDPDAAALGYRLFFDARLSANGAVSCATCHRPERVFTDGLPVSVGIAAVQKNAPSVVGAAYSPWLFWDGRADSLWSQAAAPLENPLEHGSHRLQVVEIVAADDDYRRRYETVFGPMPEIPRRIEAEGGSYAAAWERLTDEQRNTITRVFVDLTKALAAYERLLLPGPSRFDRYAAALLGEASGDPAELFEAKERRGLKLFIGRGQCTNCHNGPLFTNHAFHNNGNLSAPGQLPSRGRSEGAALVMTDPLNCLGAFSDDPERRCTELQFMKVGDALVGAHKTPSLRNVSRTAPYMHAGQLPTLEAVVEQYDEALNAMIGHNEAMPLGLSARARSDLVAFLNSLDSPVAAEARWLSPPES
jgi:cytochrome c peroxidase